MSNLREAFESSDLNATLAECEKPICWEYTRAFGQRAGRQEEEGKEVFELLQSITAPRLDLDAEARPFPSLPDVSDDHLEFLSEALDSIEEAELAARIADVLWILRRDYRKALGAIEAYLESAARLEGSYQNNRPARDRYERALGLAVRLNNSKKRGKVVQALEEKIRERADSEETIFSWQYSSLLYNFNLGEPAEQASHMETAACRIEAVEEDDEVPDYWTVRRYWEQAAHWYRRADDEKAAHMARRQAAECWVKLAECAPTQINAARFYMNAYQAYRQIPDTDEQREEVHQALIQAEERSTSEYGQISSDPTEREQQEYARDAVRERSIEDALFRLAVITRSPSREELGEAARSSAQQTPLLSLSGATMTNAMGKVVGRKPSAFEDEDAAFEHLVHEAANHHRHFDAVNLIRPAREQVLAEHSVRLRDIAEFLQYSPVIPDGRYLAYSKGLYAGLRGDHMTATHLLVPQLEESLRHLLRQRGVITSGVNNYLVQHERNLNRMLTEGEYRSHIVEMIGEALTFNLQGILVDPHGANLRNDVAHGLLSDGALWNMQAVYLWWIALRICVLFSSRFTFEDSSGES